MCPKSSCTFLVFDSKNDRIAPYRHGEIQRAPVWHLSQAITFNFQILTSWFNDLTQMRMFDRCTGIQVFPLFLNQLTKTLLWCLNMFNLYRKINLGDGLMWQHQSLHQCTKGERKAVHILNKQIFTTLIYLNIDKSIIMRNWSQHKPSIFIYVVL